MRILLVILVAAILFFSALIIAPRIIEAKRDKSPAAENGAFNNPGQGRSQMTVGESIRNDTSAPVREMKQQPVSWIQGRCLELAPIPAGTVEILAAYAAGGCFGGKRHADSAVP